MSLNSSSTYGDLSKTLVSEGLPEQGKNLLLQPRVTISAGNNFMPASTSIRYVIRYVVSHFLTNVHRKSLILNG
jgi:hypothetical protein